MSGWYVAPCLAVLRAEVDTRWPNRDRGSDGSIGDAAHQASKSDHNPNERGSVNALDIDKDGIDVDEVIAAIERHPSTHYWIYRRQIADRDDGWRRRPYTGSNPHDKHLHVSIRQSRTAEQDRRPWGLLEDDMTPAELLNTEIPNPVTGKPAKVKEFLQSINREAYTARLAAQAALAQVKGIDGTDEKALAAELLKVLTPAAIAAALPPDLAQQVADELAARLAS